MKLNKLKTIIVLLSIFSVLFMGNVYASNLVARGGHPGARPGEFQHPAASFNHGNYHPAVNRGVENRAFNNGVEAGAIEGAAVNGAGGINSGVVYPNSAYYQPVQYVVPSQPNVQYVVPTSVTPATTTTPVTVPQQ